MSKINDTLSCYDFVKALFKENLSHWAERNDGNSFKTMARETAQDSNVSFVKSLCDYVTTEEMYCDYLKEEQKRTDSFCSSLYNNNRSDDLICYDIKKVFQSEAQLLMTLENAKRFLNCKN